MASENVHTYTSEARLLSETRKLSKALLVSSTSNCDKRYNCIQIKILGLDFPQPQESWQAFGFKNWKPPPVWRR